MAFSRSSVKLRLGVGIFVLTLATASIHLFLAFTAIPYFGLNFGVIFIVHPKWAGVPGASGGLAVANPATGTIPERCPMGPGSLRDTDDRALVHHGAVV
jgi:hypothetical protein